MSIWKTQAEYMSTEHSGLNTGERRSWTLLFSQGLQQKHLTMGALMTDLSWQAIPMCLIF